MRVSRQVKHVLFEMKHVLSRIERVLFVSLLVAGCNQGALAPAEADLGIGNFCSGPARVQMNGMTAESPSVTGRLMILNCCEAAEFDFVSQQISEPLFFAWRHFGGTEPKPPATLDLTNLPQGWMGTLYSGCSPSSPGCTPSDLLTNGLSGSLTVNGGGQAGFQMSVCLNAVAEGHPVLRSVRLWSPTIVAQ
jgi:hypothetical protein